MLQLSFVLFPLTLSVVLTVIGQRRRVLAGVLCAVIAVLAFLPALPQDSRRRPIASPPPTH